MNAQPEAALAAIDYVVVEWPDRQPDGSALPALLDLVDRGLIGILDLVFIAKAEDGSVAVLALEDLGDAFAVFEGASSGLLDEDDLQEAGSVLRPGTSAAVLVWANLWAAPFAAALRAGGAQLVATGRIPLDDLEAALDAAEARD